jgi:photosystem II stability/assembly factor-like uncharacterized protein
MKEAIIATMTDESPDLSPDSDETKIQDVVYALAAAPDFEQSGTCFAAQVTGLFRSPDKGRTWQDAYASLKLDSLLPTAAVALSPQFETDRTVFAGVAGAVLRSSDGGQTWTVATLPSPPPIVSMLIVSPNYAHDGMVFAGTLEDGVFHSNNRGERWVSWNFGLLDLRILALVISPDFAHDETLFVGTDSGIYRSTNGGRAWREVDFPLEFAPVLSLAISPHFASDGILLAGTEANGLFRSNDRGRTWTRLGQAVIGEAINNILLSPEFPGKADLLVITGDTLLISRDGGESWLNWQADLSLEESPTSVIAPQGLAPGAPLLVGLLDGQVLQI